MNVDDTLTSIPNKKIWKQINFDDTLTSIPKKNWKQINVDDTLTFIQKKNIKTNKCWWYFNILSN